MRSSLLLILLLNVLSVLSLKSPPVLAKSERYPIGISFFLLLFKIRGSFHHFSSGSSCSATLPTIAHSIPVKCPSTSGSSCEYKCDLGYGPGGNIGCGRDGKWVVNGECKGSLEKSGREREATIFLPGLESALGARDER